MEENNQNPMPQNGKKPNRYHHKHHKNQAENPQSGSERKPQKNGQNRSQKQGGKQQESRIYNPYERTKQEQMLADLRAKIVVKSADEEKASAEASAAELLDRLDREEPRKEAGNKQVEVIGIRFRSVGKTYYFAPNRITAKRGDFAIVETARGPEFGEVVIANRWVSESETFSPLRPVLRLATETDIAHNEENRVKEQKALEICRRMIPEHKLEMKLIDVQYAFDNSVLLFYFTSDGRVDFRELVKDLASTFHTRIELRQIGIRDEAKLLGGIGACGRVVCCSSFLPDFAQVSIKMAKEQSLSLNSSKISGVCGRLMCCLRFESETYTEEIRRTPSINAIVKTPDGVGKVVSTVPLAGIVRVQLNDTPDTPPKQYTREEVTLLSPDRKKDSEPKNRDEDAEKEE